MTDTIQRYGPGSPVWQEDVQRAMTNWHLVTDEPLAVFPAAYVVDPYGGVQRHLPEARRKPLPPVRLVEAAAGTGSRFLVVVTPLGPWGQWATSGQAMVAVQHPWAGVYPMQYDGTLHSGYVQEKLVPSGRVVNAGDLAGLTLTIGFALGRQTVIDGYES